MFELIDANTGEILKIQETDFEKSLNWYEANDLCKKLGNKYRLPKRSEFEQMHKELFINGLGNFNSTFYWCTEDDGKSALIFNMSKGEFDPNVQGEYFVWEYSDLKAVRVVFHI